MQIVHQSKPVVPRDKFIDLPIVEVLVCAKKSTIYGWTKDPNSDFPRPIRFSSRMVRWSESAVLQWVQNRINQATENAVQAPAPTSASLSTVSRG